METQGQMPPADAAPVATLRLYADGLEPSLVNSVIHLEPDAAAAVGAPIAKRADGKPVPAKTGTWFISTKGRGLGQSPQTHLSWVVTLAQDHLPELKKKVPGIKASLSLLVHAREFTPARHLSRALIETAISIGGLEIENPDQDFDIVVDHSNYSSLFSR